MNILILGASYGSLFGTKCLMAGHNATLVCRAPTAALINSDGTEVRIKLRDEAEHRAIRSGDQPGKLDASPPEEVDVARFDLVVLAMQEPQYGVDAIRALLLKIADAGLPCLSLMNMPPLAYLKRIASIDASALAEAYTDPQVWEAFDPANVTLCSPDPQAFRPPEEKPNVLHVGLPTNFKAARFGSDAATAMLTKLADDIENVRLDGKDVPVKLRVHDSLYVPLAKWSMLLTGNYRCVLPGSVQPIRDAVHSDFDESRAVYAHVGAIVEKLGGDAGDMVPFEKYAKAAESLLKPSSVARAIDGGATRVERVDRLVASLGASVALEHPVISRNVGIVDDALKANSG